VYVHAVLAECAAAHFSCTSHLKAPPLLLLLLLLLLPDRL
jgi:hypothetical protein